MPRRARYLIPTQLPRRGEVMAVFAVLVLLAHLLLAQLTLGLAVLFVVVSKATRWRLWWLIGPAAAGLAWTLADPRSAAAGFAAGPAHILGYLSGGHWAARLLHPHGALAGAGGWLPRQFPVALIAAAAEAALAGWLNWVHTDEWAVPPRRPGVLAAARGALGGRMTRAGAVVTRDGCVLGLAPGNGARVVLNWSELAGGMLVTGSDPRAVAVSSLQLVHAALRRRKPLIAVDLGGAGVPAVPLVPGPLGAPGVPGVPGTPRAASAPSALAGVLGAACSATGTPLRAVGEGEAGDWVRQGPDGTRLARVVRERSAVLLTAGTPGAASQICGGMLALGAELRAIGADGDGLVWLYDYEPAPDGGLSPLVASLLASGAAAGLPVLVTSTSPRAVEELAGSVSVVLVHRLADAAAADILAARTGTRLVPAGPALAAADLVPRPAVAARTLLSLRPAEFVLAVSSPGYRLVAPGQAVAARLPRGAVL